MQKLWGNARRKSGRAFNGGARDAGSIVHCVPCTAYPSWEKALCGTKPGASGNGWQETENIENITCKKCLKILAT